MPRTASCYRDTVIASAVTIEARISQEGKMDTGARTAADPEVLLAEWLFAGSLKHRKPQSQRFRGVGTIRSGFQRPHQASNYKGKT